MAWLIRRGSKQVFYVGWKNPRSGRDTYKSAHTTDEREAKKVLLQKEIELGEIGSASVQDSMEVIAPGELTIDGLISRYVKNTKLTENTRRINTNSWKMFQELTGVTLVHLVTVATAVDFLMKLEAKKYSDTYIFMFVRDMRKLWRYAVDEELAESNPFKKIPLPQDVKVARDVTYEDENLILECATPWLKRFAKIQRLLGLRPGQVAALNWRQINLRQMNLTIPKFKRQPERIIPIFDDLLPYLGTPKHEGIVFPEFDGKTTKQAQRKFNREWQRARKRAVKKGLRGRFRLTDLRHAKASELAQKLSPHELAHYFGWSTVRMTDRYVHTRLETIRAKLQKPTSPAA